LQPAGYSRDEGFGLLSTAARDSIMNNWELTRDVLQIKLKEGLTPRTTEMTTYPLPDESGRERREIESKFFDAESLNIPVLIKLQRAIYDLTQRWYDNLYQYWVWIGLIALYFCLHRKPVLIWGALVLITLSRIFIPDILGNAVWRYTLLGMVLLQMLAITWIITTAYGVKDMIAGDK
jgi:hypothetical protein